MPYASCGCIQILELGGSTLQLLKQKQHYADLLRAVCGKNNSISLIVCFDCEKYVRYIIFIFLNLMCRKSKIQAINFRFRKWHSCVFILSKIIEFMFKENFKQCRQIK